MDYANLHSHHQLQEQVDMIGHSTSSATSSGNYTWNTGINTLNNDTDFYPNETMPNSRLLLPSLASSFMAYSQDSSYSFDQTIFARRPSIYEPPIPSTKEETSDSFSRLRINIPSDQIEKSNLVPPNLYKQGDDRITGLTNHDPSSRFLHPIHETFYPNDHNSNASFGLGFDSSGHAFHNASNRTLARARSGSSSPSFLLNSNEGFNNNSRALDLLSSPRSSNYHSTAQSCSHSTQDSSNLGLFRECSMSLGHVDRHIPRTSPSKNMKSGLFNEVTRTKKRSPSGLNSDEPKYQIHNAEANKKSKSTSRSSNPPLKVRKEKLGDRISGLHRLVAPFGKTDTASVLSETIGYIQFLHDQVQTLSTPYMKLLQSKPSRKLQQVHGFGKDNDEQETEVTRVDLRSRGLCLVPVSCASYLDGFD